MKIQQTVRSGIGVLFLGVLTFLNPAFSVQAGNLPWEIWALSGYPSIADLTNSGTLNNTPDAVFTISNSFDTFNVGDTDDHADDYSSRIRGFLQVPETGTYYLCLSSAEESQLSLSTNSDPANLAVVAQETNSGAALFSGDRLAQRTSPPLNLVKGQSYYFEVLHTAADSGSDWIRVGWQTPEGLQEIIPALFLLPWSPDITAPVISDQPADTNVVEGTPLVLTTTVQALQPATFQWFKNGQPIVGENIQSLVYPSSDPTNAGVYYLEVTDSNNDVIISSNATVTVQLDITPPAISSVELNSRSNLLTVVFSKPVDPNSATNSANYVLNNGTGLSGASLAPDGVTLNLNVTGLSPGQSGFTLAVSGISDHYQNIITPVTVPVDLLWTETFSGGPGFFTAANDNQGDGNSFGYSFSLNAGGAVGEIGGTFARDTTANAAYIADSTLGGTISLSNNVVFRGQLFIHNLNANDNFFFGFAPSTGNFNSLFGVQIAEPNSSFAPNFRIQGLADGVSSASKYPLPPDVVVPFVLSWNAAAGILSAVVGSQQFYVTNTSAASITYSSFEIGTYGEKTIVPSDNVLLYFDNLTYSVGSVRAAPLATGPTVGVTLQTPVNGQVYQQNSLVSLTAQALTAAQPVANVAFYEQTAGLGNLAQIGTVANSSASNTTFSANWNATIPGDYALTARANTVDSLSATSTPVLVHIIAPQLLGKVIEPFASGLDRFQFELNSQLDGNDFGFSNTQNAGGAAAGEIGGTFVRLTAPAYLADTNTGNLYPQFEDLDFSGQIYVQNNNWNGTAFVGFLNSTNSSALFGLDIDEPDSTSSGNFRGEVAIGTVISAQINLPPGGPINFSLHWSSTNQIVTGTVAGQPVTLPYVPLTEVFNSLAVGTLANSTTDNTAQITLFADDLNYTIVSVVPRLTIQLVNGQISLNWNGFGFKLQHSTSLGVGAAWTDDTGVINAAGNINTVSEALSSSTSFWRLVPQ